MDLKAFCLGCFVLPIRLVISTGKDLSGSFLSVIWPEERKLLFLHSLSNNSGVEPHCLAVCPSLNHHSRRGMKDTDWADLSHLPAFGEVGLSHTQIT